MIRFNFAKVGFGIAVLSAAVCSQAQIDLITASHGEAFFISPTTAFFDEGIDAQAGGFSSFDTLLYEIDTTTGAGIGELLGSSGDLNFTLQYDPTSLKLSGDGGSADGTWTITTGDGDYGAVTGGGGTIATTFLDAGAGVLFTASPLQGQIFGTPEPAPFAVMGLGVVGLIIRRRRKA